MAAQDLKAVDRLVGGAGRGTYSRREAVKRAAAIGLSVPAVGFGVGAASGRAAAQTTEPEGNIVIVLAAEPSTLENWNAYSVDGHPVLRNIFEALINRNPETNELVGELATSWERVDDRTLRFTLREGVVFHNGDPFDAEVAAFGLNYTWSPENAFDIVQFMGPQITATAVDEYTLDVATAEPDPILAERLYFSPIPNMIQIQQRPESLPAEPIGTAPYGFVAWNRGENILLTAFADWWGNAAGDAYGEVTIRDAEFVARGESAVRAAMVSAGEAQIARFLAPEDCASTPVCEKSSSVETVFLRLDTMHTVMGDPRVREAIALAVDKQALAEQLFGATDVASQLVGPSAAGYDPAVQPAPYDPERARQLVAEAQADGVPVAEAVITVAVRAGAYPRNEELGEYVANQLNEIGLNAQSQVIEHAAYQEQYVTPYDEIPADRGWIGTLTHGNEMMDVGQTAASYYVCGGGATTWCDPAFDQQVQAASVLLGEERAQAFQEITREFMANYPLVPIVHLPLFYGVAENLSWAPRLDGFMLIKEMHYA
ncbi:MAG: hypothetical protein H0U10_13270 [Chloroflexia bacterium]|nr:hypothetical protein [Chloroflexia bacterium]